MKKNRNNRLVSHRTVDIAQRLDESIRFVRSRTKLRPKIAIILGSGLGNLADALTGQQIIDSTTIPHYPGPTIAGHPGKLVFGNLQRVPVLAVQGRIHFYETGNLEAILYPIHVVHSLGIRILIVTNAAGGVDEKFQAGDLMIITDQINLTFEKTLFHRHSLVRTHELYDSELQRIILDAATKTNIPVQQGIYCGVKGPSYETASEIEMIRRIGGDAVGMSTVNEVSLAHALGMRVAGISCITNLATGISPEELTHGEVTEVASRVRVKFTELITEIVGRITVE